MARNAQRRTYRRLPQSRTAHTGPRREQRTDYDQIAADLVKRGLLPVTALDRSITTKRDPR